MKNIKFADIVGTFVLALGYANIQGQVASMPYEELRLPGGRPFPAPEGSLLRIRDNPNKCAKGKMRAHAWDLFAGLTKDQPIWNTWYTKCDVGLAGKACGPKLAEDKPNLHQLRSLEVPVQSLLRLKQLYATSDPVKPQLPALDSELFQKALMEFAIAFRDHPQFASVLFNQEAADHIRHNCLYPPDALKTIPPRKCPPLRVSRGGVVSFKRGAVVLKTVWERVVPDADLIGKLWTWDAALWKGVRKANEDVSQFNVHKVRINTGSQALCEDRDYGDDEIVPISCFYSHKVTQEDIHGLTALPPHSVTINESGVVAGNYLVLVAVHVTTKEIPDWVWATFWWDNHGASDSRAAGRPDGIKAKWRHFLMDTTLSGMTPVEEDLGPKICFNPYLETGIPNGAISNCLQCHSKAAYGSKSTVNAYDLGILGRDGKTLASGHPLVPNYFNSRVQTDFLWSIAEAEDPKIQSLMDLFETQLNQLELQELRLKELKVTPPLAPNQ